MALKSGILGRKISKILEIVALHKLLLARDEGGKMIYTGPTYNYNETV